MTRNFLGVLLLTLTLLNATDGQQPSDTDANEVALNSHRSVEGLAGRHVLGPRFIKHPSDKAGGDILRRHGCHKRHCWSSCNAVFKSYREWCYTTKGRTQDYNYVRCTQNSDCQWNWACAGSCTL